MKNRRFISKVYMIYFRAITIFIGYVSIRCFFPAHADVHGGILSCFCFMQACMWIFFKENLLILAARSFHSVYGAALMWSSSSS